MFKIAGKDFYEYVAYRLKKDKLGFVPSGRWEDGATDMKTFIKSVVPKSSYDFLVFAHELGHCKSEQYMSTSGVSFFGGVDINHLKSEFNAWVWAIRYVKKLKLEVTLAEWTDALNKSFKTYTKRHEDAKVCNDFIEKLNDMLGISLEMESVRITRNNTFIIGTFAIFDDKYKDWVPVLPKKTEEFKPMSSPNKKHKPWMDMLDSQRKKYQKHSRKFA